MLTPLSDVSEEPTENPGACPVQSGKPSAEPAYPQLTALRGSRQSD